MTHTVHLQFEDIDNTVLQRLCGALDGNLEALGKALDIQISRRFEHFTFMGELAHAGRRALLALAEAAEQGDLDDNAAPSYKRVTQPESSETVPFANKKGEKATRPEPAVKGVHHASPPPAPAAAEGYMRWPCYTPPVPNHTSACPGGKSQNQRHASPSAGDR